MERRSYHANECVRESRLRLLANELCDGDGTTVNKCCDLIS